MLIGIVAALLAPGWATGNPERIAKGRAVFVEACAQCHGADGRGNPAWESEVRPVAFDDCGTTAEPSEHWQRVVRDGGASVGLSPVMPAFEGAFTADEIESVVAYLRTFCASADRFPPGDLNFRRPLKTGKAYPEVETVLRASHTPRSGEKETELEILIEKRLGPRFQYELALPFRAQASGGDGTGIGDIEVEGKYVLGFDAARRFIVSGGLGATLPTGSKSKGLGSGTAAIEPFVAVGKAFGGGRTILQARLATGQPFDRAKADPDVAWAMALSRALGPPRNAWTPAVEWVGVHNTKTGGNESSLWIETSKPFNKLGHVIGSFGVQIPLRPQGKGARLEAYLLWDFGDGPVWVGW